MSYTTFHNLFLSDLERHLHLFENIILTQKSDYIFTLEIDEIKMYAYRNQPLFEEELLFTCVK